MPKPGVWDGGQLTNGQAPLSQTANGLVSKISAKCQQRKTLRSAHLTSKESKDMLERLVPMKSLALDGNGGGHPDHRAILRFVGINPNVEGLLQQRNRTRHVRSNGVKNVSPITNF